MQKLFFLLVCGLLLTACGNPTPLDEQAIEVPDEVPTEESNDVKVVDMLQLLDAIPDQYVWRGGLEKKDLVVDVNDPENYYLSFTIMNIEGFGTLAVFLDEEGGQTVAISTTGCGPICGQDLYFLRENSGVWTDVTTEIFPKLNEAEAATKADEVLAIRHAAGLRAEEDYFAPLYVLPQHGTTIEMIDQYDPIYGPELGVLFRFNWKNGTFEKEEVLLNS